MQAWPFLSMLLACCSLSPGDISYRDCQIAVEIVSEVESAWLGYFGECLPTSSLAFPSDQITIPVPDRFEAPLVPDGFGPSLIPDGFGPSLVPDGFRPSEFGPSLVPDGFGPSFIPDGFGPSLVPDGLDSAKDAQ